MVILTWAESEPPLLLAQIVYAAAVVWRTVGVPHMLPFVEPKDKPFGSEGDISHEVTSPPPAAGVFVVIVVPFSSVMFSGE